MEKYKRPPNDPLFQARSWAEWQIERYEDLLQLRADLLEHMESGQSGGKQALSALSALDAVLGETATVVGDPLIDRWEKDLAEGREPDLDAQG